MSLTPSNMLPLGTVAPSFSLIDTLSDKIISLKKLKGEKGTLVMFICNHCPYVIHVIPMLVKIATIYQKLGINFIAISSNDAKNFPQDAPHLMKKNAIIEGFVFPYLYDRTQEVAIAYDAACTPDFYLFNCDLELVYRGQLDGSRPENKILLSGTDLTKAMDNLLNNKPISTDQKPSMGCSIKWIN